MRTGEPSIFAIGDVVGEPMLAHKASHEGRVAVEVIAGQKAAFAPRAIPAVVFTDPEIAWAGLTETQAQKAGRTVTVAKFPWAASGRAITLDRVDGLTKLLIDPATERILGVGIVGSGAGELIAEGVLAIEMGANATDLKLSIHPHPTLTETLMEAGRSVLRPGDARLQAEENVKRETRNVKRLQRRLPFSVFRFCSSQAAPAGARPAANARAASNHASPTLSPYAVGRYQRRGRPIAPGGSGSVRDST